MRHPDPTNPGSGVIKMGRSERADRARFQPTSTTPGGDQPSAPHPGIVVLLPIPRKLLKDAVSPGPLKTRAASGLKDFNVLLFEAIERAPIGELVDIDDVGLTAAYLTTPFARRLTGTTTYVDGGLSIMA